MTEISINKNINFKFVYQIILIFFGLTYLLLIAGNTSGLININVLILNLIFIIVSSLVWLIKPGRRHLPLIKPVLIWFIIFTITTFFSIDPRRSLDQFVLSLTGAFFFYFVFYLLEKGLDVKIIYQAILIFGAVFMLLAWLEFGAWYRIWLIYNPGEIIPLLQYRPGSANILALILNLILVVAASQLIHTNSRSFLRFSLIPYIISILMLIYVTSSRGGWLGTVAGLTLFVCLLPLIYQNQSRNFVNRIRQKPLIFYGIIAGLLVLAIVFLFVLIAQSKLPTHGGLFTSRSAFWSPAWQEFLEHPITGSGPFTYGSTFIKFNSTPQNVIYAHSHGTIINTLTEMGILGLAAGLFLVSSLTVKLKKVLNLENREAKIQALVAFSALTAVGVHSIFDCFHLEPGGLWLLIILCVIPLFQIQQQGHKNIRPWWVISLIGLLSFLLWVKIPYHQGVSLANQNQWQVAKAQFETDVHRDPYSAIAHLQLALVDSVLSVKGDASLIAESIAELQGTIKSEPSWSLNYANLAALYKANGNLPEAQKAAAQSVSLAPKMALFQLQLGEIAEKNRDTSTALTAYQQAISLENDWTSSEFWTSTDLRQQVIENWNNAHPIAQPVSLEEAKRIFQSNTQSRWAYNQLSAAYLEEGDLDQAEVYLNNANLAYTDRPLEAIETDWLMAEVSAERGNFALAAELGEKALNNYHAYGVYGPGSFGLLYYAPRMFRMPAIALEIVPQMIKPLIPEEWVEREKRVEKWKEK